MPTLSRWWYNHLVAIGLIIIVGVNFCGLNGFVFGLLVHTFTVRMCLCLGVVWVRVFACACLRGAHTRVCGVHVRACLCLFMLV